MAVPGDARVMPYKDWPSRHILYSAFYFLSVNNPLRIDFLTINNITIIYFFCPRSSNNLYPALKIKYFTTRINFRLSCSDLKTKTRVKPDSTTQQPKCIKKCSCLRNKTQYDHNEIEECPSVSTWKCSQFVFKGRFVVVYPSGGLLYISLHIESCNNICPACH